ncbi:efflux RND transporter periplasmic adaptor subunit [Photorhabdus temperata]|uniref:efflux RND transporter periplasmic adaptor subunit n=1 Tax=Photorhabdus temperata TaxID=574560 RepID=UPI0004CE3FCB|nr:biotin/lipoyl-binding protein [Photorhabdus temperata]
MLVKKKKWVVITIIMIVFLAVIYNKFNRKETPAVITEQIITGTLGDVITIVDAAGVIQPTRQVNVGSQISGQLNQLHVEVGDVVEAGKLVASIDDTFYRTKVEASRARLEKLRAILKEERYTYELLSITEKRQRQLNLRSATSQQLLDEATFGVKKSQARIESLNADIRQNEHILRNEEVSLSYTQIYSPIAGVAVYYTVLFDVPNDNFLLKPSMSADVTIVTHESTGVVTIPSDVLNNKRHQPLDNNLTAYFLREMKDGNIVVRKLFVGHNDGIRSVVTNGLQNNEQIVVLAKQDIEGIREL